MSKKTPDKFSLYVPDEQEPETKMPSRLEVVDYNPAKKSRDALRAGAYDPYGKDGGTTADTSRMRRPRADLRKLSQWIKLKQGVEEARNPSPEPDKTKQK